VLPHTSQGNYVAKEFM